ncbi:hypothetical protein C5167_024699 [Papaver somniferum]|uniref:Uncharacterized protein n=1 Tax=Papaver somniferum TaxID=3469 RepID=A0A4Y7JT36_PAPSO|nr:hypothetical protein C5167_024699 [Papaver somniferum]
MSCATKEIPDKLEICMDDTRYTFVSDIISMMPCLCQFKVEQKEVKKLKNLGELKEVKGEKEGYSLYGDARKLRASASMCTEGIEEGRNI